MADGGISQDELDRLFGVGGGLEELPEIHDKNSPVWIVKDTTTRAVCGGRCWSLAEAQKLLNEAMKSYPNNRFEIKQVR